jgi:hypothetical protein
VPIFGSRRGAEAASGGAKTGEGMSNNVQSHEDVAEHAAGEDRRAGVRHAARSLGSVTARIIGGSPVDLVNFSSRGVLFECDSRLLIGARASVRITTSETNLVVTGRVVRSRVKGLVNGALRYDAALVLDAELNLTPAVVAAVRAETRSQESDADFVADDLVTFESELDPAVAPSPVEAYLAESEASLLDAHVSESPLHFMGAVEVAPFEAADAPGVAAEPPPLPDAAAAAGEAVADEPIAFEPDGDIAFEPAVEFAFDEVGEPSFEAAAAVAAIELAAAEESAGTSMFDATYIPPADDLAPPAESQFVVTPPTPVQDDGTSSLFDPRPSESYGEALVEPVAEASFVEPTIDVHVSIHADLVSVPDGEVAAGDVAEPIDFETDVAFEAEDAVMFEPAFDGTPVEIESAPADIESAPAVIESAPAVIESAPAETGNAAAAGDRAGAAPVDLAVAGPIDLDVVAPIDASPDAPADAPADDDLPALVPVVEDRVLLQFAATVPPDLAELQRIAADNQW